MPVQARHIHNVQPDNRSQIINICNWKRPFRRPRKIRTGDAIEGAFAISEDELLLLREYSNGKSVDDLAWGLGVHKSTICRTLRAIVGKMIKQTRIAKPVQEEHERI